MRNAIARSSFVALLFGALGQAAPAVEPRTTPKFNDDATQSLIGAIAEDRHWEITGLIARGGNPNAKYQNSPLLTVALGYCGVKGAIALIKGGAQVNVTDKRGETTLALAGRCNDNAELMTLLKQRTGATSSPAPTRQLPPQLLQPNSPATGDLVGAVAEDRDWEVTPLIAKGANPDAKLQNSPLLAVALSYCGMKTAVALIKGGAQVNVILKRTGETALVLANKCQNNGEVITLLKQRGVKR